jgi:dCMP deaminase
MRPTWDETWLDLAKLMARRSRCPSGAGAVIVDTKQRIVSTGYAGPPAGYRLEDEHLISDRPLRPDDTCQVYCPRANKTPNERDPGYQDCPSSHAEINAMSKANRSETDGGTFYVSSVPCFGCAKAVANSGVVRVVWPTTTADVYRGGDAVIDFLVRCEIQVVIIS